MSRIAMRFQGLLPAMLIAGSVLVSHAVAQSTANTQTGAGSQSTAKPAMSAAALVGNHAVAAARKPVAATPLRYMPNQLPRRAQMFYQGVWGVDSMRVKTAESGEIVRFSWRVLDPRKAAPLNDKKIEPELIDPQAGVKLVIPQLENVGTLRQTSAPTEGKVYWMAFSNSGRRVKPGHRVIVAIGQFHAVNLVVE